MYPFPNHLERIHDLLWFLPVFQPRLYEADPLSAIVGGDVQDAGSTHRRRRSVLEVSDLEDHPHVRLAWRGSDERSI